MSQDSLVNSLLDIARQTITASGCASLITMDENGDPSSRSVAAFAPDDDFARIVIGTHPDSRKTSHVMNDPRVLLSYTDDENRGYVTVIGDAHIDTDIEQKKKYWVDRFRSFFPDGAESEEYQLIVVIPRRLEVRSFGLKAAEEPTRWSPETLEKDGSGDWKKIS